MNLTNLRTLRTFSTPKSMSKIERFEDLECWKSARELTQMIYQLSNRGEFARDFGLRDQMRRAAVSVLSNIAEGFESHTRPLFIEYLSRAKASCGEFRAQVYVALDAGYFDQSQFVQIRALAEKCSRQISNFINYLKQDTRYKVSEPKELYESSERYELSEQGQTD